MDCAMTQPALALLDSPCFDIPNCPLGAHSDTKVGSAGSYCKPLASDTMRAPVEGGCDCDLVSAAAYLHLLGESLLLIGDYLQETDRLVCVSTSVSVLLDSLLCTLAPLMSLSSQIPELRDCLEHTMIVPISVKQLTED